MNYLSHILATDIYGIRNKGTSVLCLYGRYSLLVLPSDIYI